MRPSQFPVSKRIQQSEAFAQIFPDILVIKDREVQFLEFILAAVPSRKLPRFVLLFFLGWEKLRAAGDHHFP